MMGASLAQISSVEGSCSSALSVGFGCFFGSFVEFPCAALLTALQARLVSLMGCLYCLREAKQGVDLLSVLSSCWHFTSDLVLFVLSVSRVVYSLLYLPGSEPEVSWQLLEGKAGHEPQEEGRSYKKRPAQSPGTLPMCGHEEKLPRKEESRGPQEETLP